jgi:hypothetical protein
MSQNPSGPNYNPNPYEPNPNYPGISGTSYGGGPSSAPPPGQNPNYVYPSPNPPFGGNPGPNASEAGYRPYESPGAYPPPPPGPNPYIAPAPPPVTPVPNPYDPYAAPTAISQPPPPSAGYPPYTSYPPAGPVLEGMPMPVVPPGPSQSNRLGLVITLALAVVLVVGGSIFGVVAYNNHQNTVHANATATVDSQVTATAQIYATGTAVASIYPFSNKLVLDDPMVDNSKGVNWDNDQKTGCFFSGSAYHVVQAKSGFYNTCAAVNSDYSNFTFETEMVIKSGGDGSGGASGGLLFRAEEGNNKYYRLSIDTNGSYFILVIVDSTGTNGNARIMKQGTASSFLTGLGQTNNLAIVANGSEYTFYVNKQKVDSFIDSTYTHGQIGFDADYGTSSTELVFTNTKVWQLP